MLLTAGSRVGSYEIVSPLGAGSMGEVYVARDSRLGRDVAIKILPAASTADPDQRARLEREARVLAALNHPNIAAIYGVEDIPGGLALVLELAVGQTLEDHTRRQRSQPAVLRCRLRWPPARDRDGRKTRCRDRRGAALGL
jgi:serine/threonine protein kinase